MGTTTEKLGLYKPADGEKNWGSGKVTENFQKIDDNHDLHDEISEMTSGHGIALQNTLDTEVADLGDALGDRMKQLIMLYGM